LTYSQNYPKIQWNRHGWMCLTTDFDNTVDSTVKNWQTGTTPTEGATPLLPDSSRGHVPSEPKSEAQQLSVI
jgi:type II secretory pathway component PulJ